MGTLPSERNQVKNAALANVIPDAAAVPAAHTDFLAIVNAMEPRLVLRLPTMSIAETEPNGIAPLENGMVVVTTSSPYEIWFRVAGAWKKVWPTIYNGTGTPAAGLGADDDLYIQY